MEACQGAHHGAREMRKLGHNVRLISPQFVTGLLSEYRIVVAQGVHRLRKSLPALLEDAEHGLTCLSRELSLALYRPSVWSDERVGVMDHKLLHTTWRVIA